MYYQILIKDAFQEPALRLLSFALLLPNPSLRAEPKSAGARLGRGQGASLVLTQGCGVGKFQMDGSGPTLASLGGGERKGESLRRSQPVWV